MSIKFTKEELDSVKELEKTLGINLHVKKQVSRGASWGDWVAIILGLTVIGYIAYLYMAKGIEVMPW